MVYYFLIWIQTGIDWSAMQPQWAHRLVLVAGVSLGAAVTYFTALAVLGWRARELRRDRKNATRLRDGKRSVLTRGKRVLDGARAFSGVKLCGDTMNEHVTPLRRFVLPMVAHPRSFAMLPC